MRLVEKKSNHHQQPQQYDDDHHDQHQNQCNDDRDHELASSWTMELSRWRVRLRRLKRWSKYEGRASDGQFDTTSDLPDDSHEGTTTTTPPPPPVQRLRHSLTSVDALKNFDRARFAREPIVPPVRIPKSYRQQDRQRGVRVGGDRVPFTLAGHLRRRKLVRPLTRIEESEPLDGLAVPDMRNSMASVYALKGRARRAFSV